jgi:lipopolysaccharide exporter
MISSVLRDVKNLWEGFKVENSFTRNLAITFSGHAIGQVLGFLFTPFIARIYGPENYGIFALFSAIASNFALISTFQLPTGYVAARTDRELHVLVRLTMFILLFFTVFSILLVVFFKDGLIDLFDAGNLKLVIYFIPLYVFFMGFDYILLGWNIYLKQFSRGALAKVSSIIASKGGTLLYGLFSPTAIGLILGNFVIYPLESTFKLSKEVRKDFRHVAEKMGWQELKEVFLRFKTYPLLVTPGLLVTNLNGQLPVFCFSFFFQNANVGLFALASSVVTVPLSVITNSTTTVFLQKAAETQKNNPELLGGLISSLHRKLFLVCFLPLTIFAFCSEWLFSLVFGSVWYDAGIFAAFLAISAMLSVPQQPMSVLFRLMHREHYNLLLNIASIALRATGLAVGVYFNDVQIAVAGYALASTLTMAFSIGLIFRMVKINLTKLLGYLLAVIFVFILVILQKF